MGENRPAAFPIAALVALSATTLHATASLWTSAPEQPPTISQ
jgi:hypothetical protein